MCVWIVDADAVEPRHRAIRLREHVIGVLGAMATFDQCRTSIAFHNAVGSGLHVFLITNQRISQDLGFRNVRCDHSGHGE